LQDTRAPRDPYGKIVERALGLLAPDVQRGDAAGSSHLPPALPVVIVLIGAE
jgi:hypothetical protein